MKKCLIYGNCQIVAIKHLLLQNPLFNQTYQFVELNPVFLLTAADASAVAELVSEVDLFIHQPVSEQYKGKALSTDFLRDLARASAQIISIPVSYFTGYSPELAYIKNQEGAVLTEPFPYHDRNVLSFYSQAKTIQETIEAIQSEDFYEPEYCRNNLAQTLANLAVREEEQKLDVGLSEFIKANFERYRLFHTFDHPSVAIVQFISNSILQFLGIQPSTDESNYFDKPEMLDDYAFPIYPSLKKHLALQFESSSKYRCAFNMLDPEKVIESYFNFYAQNEDLIKINLSSL